MGASVLDPKQNADKTTSLTKLLGGNLSINDRRPFLVIGLLEGNPMPQEDNLIIHRRLLLVLGLEGNPMPLEDNSIIHHRLLLVLGEQSPDVPDSELLHTLCN